VYSEFRDFYQPVHGNMINLSLRACGIRNRLRKVEFERTFLKYGACQS
jgi:hypothetical protein